MGKFLLGVLIVLSLLSCYSNSGRYSFYNKPNRNFIYYTEIRAENLSNAYNLILKLRPNWVFLSFNPTVVYVDDTKYGEIATLRDLNTAYIVELEFIKHMEAFFRFGSNVGGRNNVILVTTGTD